MKKINRTEEVVNQYMNCKLPGCYVELLVWYHPDNTDASMLLDSNHCHGKEDLKMETKQINI